VTTPLARLLRARIAEEGPVDIASWMRICLDHPEHGYYRRRGAIGAAGDFVTAPEISQIFGELIGAWCAATWTMLGRPDPVRLVELGPGRGTLLADALRALARPAADFVAALDLHLVEINPVLRAAQRQAIARRAHWHERLDTLPDGPAIILANEFLDALPVRQLVRDGAHWRERRIAGDDDGFRFVAGETVDAPLRLAGWPPPRDGDIVELGDDAVRLCERLAARLTCTSGVALFIDYGPAHPGYGDTLQAIRGHRRVSPLESPGESDLTVHVDFTRLAHAVAGTAVRAWGPLPQAVFLTRLGLHARAAALAARADAAQRRALERSCARLIAPDEMGTLFKAFTLTSGIDESPPGFDATATS
jgi:SAM-dependent MidA family methyltransferase